MESNEKFVSVLIVDDMRFSRAVLRTALKEAGYSDVRTTDSGNHALELLRERKSDVVLANWTMPEMTGIDLAEKIREMDKLTNHYSAIILFTAKEGNAPLLEAFRRGVDDYVRIPVDNQELVGRVYAAGRLSHLQNALLRRSQASDSSHHRELASLNLIDSATGLGNQRYLYVRLGNILKTVVQDQFGGLSLALLQLSPELLKTMPEAEQNHLLEQVGRRLQNVTRSDDVIAYLGNYCFAILLFRASPQPFDHAIFERLQAVSHTPELFSLNTKPLRLHSALGACHYHLQMGHVGADGIIQCAQRALAKALEEKSELEVRLLG
jgi:PleD family two-component response regulator